MQQKAKHSSTGPRALPKGKPHLMNCLTQHLTFSLIKKKQTNRHIGKKMVSFWSPRLGKSGVRTPVSARTGELITARSHDQASKAPSECPLSSDT